MHFCPENIRILCGGHAQLNKKRGTLCVPSPSHLIWFASMQCSTPQLSPVQFQGQAGDQHRDGLAISCGHAAQYMATIGAIYGGTSNIDLKFNKPIKDGGSTVGLSPCNKPKDQQKN